MKCKCEECRKSEPSLVSKVADAVIDTGLKMAVGAVVASTVSAVTGNPVAGYVAAKFATGGVSGPEDLIS